MQLCLTQSIDDSRFLEATKCQFFILGEIILSRFDVADTVITIDATKRE